MGKIIKQSIDIISPIMANNDLRYALKHHKDGVKFQGIWQCDQFRDGKLIAGGYPEPPNIFPTEGINKLLDIMFWTTARTDTELFYVGIFKGNITPLVADLAATCLGAAGTYIECQNADYSETERRDYTTVAAASRTITNEASKADFTIVQPLTVYGAFLASIADKASSAGYLMAAKRFAAPRAVIAADELAVTYEISVAD